MQIEIINGTLHQWDTGRQVQVTLDEGTTLREVRFSHHRSPSPVRVAPEAGNVADIPDELLRHSGMLWVTAIVVDAYGKPQTHSRCVCTECAVRPDDYNAGGGGAQPFVIELKITLTDDGEEEVTTLMTPFDDVVRAINDGINGCTLRFIGEFPDPAANFVEEYKNSYFRGCSQDIDGNLTAFGVTQGSMGDAMSEAIIMDEAAVNLVAMTIYRDGRFVLKSKIVDMRNGE